jgi:choline-sulfatase
MYNPDKMPDPVKSNIEIDHMDEQIPFMNHVIWAEDINDSHARALKARYYGEISYIDTCLGKILDCVEESPDSDNTLICFCSDHGDHLGDHHGWQKESFFDASCRIPFLLSWPERLPAGEIRDELISLADLFGIATGAAGKAESRDGINLLEVLDGNAQEREFLTGMYEVPGTQFFKIMVRDKEWKYIFMANGGFEQLFNVHEDPYELKNLAMDKPEILKKMYSRAITACGTRGAKKALDKQGCLKYFPFFEREKSRIHQFDCSAGVGKNQEFTSLTARRE